MHSRTIAHLTKETNEWIDDVSSLAAGCLVTGQCIEKEMYEKAMTIIVEEIHARFALGDYPFKPALHPENNSFLSPKGSPEDSARMDSTIHPWVRSVAMNAAERLVDEKLTKKELLEKTKAIIDEEIYVRFALGDYPFKPFSE